MKCRTSIKNGVAIDVNRMEEQQMRKHYIDNLRNFVISSTYVYDLE